MNQTMPCPELNNISDTDMALVVSYRNEIASTKEISPDARKFIEYLAETYSAKTIVTVAKLLNQL